jgi:hypothetical protein
MLSELQDFLANKPHQLQLVDIDSSPELAQLWGDRIPVLCVDGREICHYYLDKHALHNAMA